MGRSWLSCSFCLGAWWVIPWILVLPSPSWKWNVGHSDGVTWPGAEVSSDEWWWEMRFYIYVMELSLRSQHRWSVPAMSIQYTTSEFAWICCYSSWTWTSVNHVNQPNVQSLPPFPPIAWVNPNNIQSVKFHCTGRISYGDCLCCHFQVWWRSNAIDSLMVPFWAPPNCFAPGASWGTPVGGGVEQGDPVACFTMSTYRSLGR